MQGSATAAAMMPASGGVGRVREVGGMWGMVVGGVELGLGLGFGGVGGF